MKAGPIFLGCIAILSINLSCKKENEQRDTSLLQDGPMSATLGKLVYVGKYGIGRNFIWGRNSNELFLNADTNLLRIDFNAKQIENLGDIGLQGKTNENSAIILTNSYKPRGGYYLYKFSTNKLEFLFPVGQNETTILNIANNHYFYWGRANTPDDPNYSCSGFCWPGPILGEVNFYHLNILNNVIKVFKNLIFFKFSKDGSKTMLGNPGYPPLYIYDNATTTFIDSIPVAPSYDQAYYFDNSIKFVETTFAGEVFIKDFNTQQILHNFQSKITIFFEIKFSSDGTKIYYRGGQINGTNMIIAIFDLVTGQEKIIAEVPYSNSGNAVNFFLLSDDNKKMLFQSANDFYIKDMN